MKKTLFLLILPAVALSGCQGSKTAADAEFPSELASFTQLGTEPVFAGTGGNTWDAMIRERGFILKEGKEWKIWYTGYNTNNIDTHFLGYATSADGIHWKRFPGNPIHRDSWVEDMCVVGHDGMYYMFAEGRNDIMHWFTSPDGISWSNNGAVKVYAANGVPIEGVLGTPTLWGENGVWYLYYEREDGGIWLATSKNLKEWKNTSDDPVIATGPEAYDKYAVAMDSIIKYNGRYYGYYHASAKEDWSEWTSDLAMSEDLIHWKKYPGNPVVGDNKSSPVIVNDGTRFRLYTMHPAVYVFGSSENQDTMALAK